MEPAASNFEVAPRVLKNVYTLDVHFVICALRRSIKMIYHIQARNIMIIFKSINNAN